MAYSSFCFLIFLLKHAKIKKILDDTKLQGNIYFKDEKLKDTFKLENTATVSGNIKVQ